MKLGRKKAPDALDRLREDLVRKQVKIYSSEEIAEYAKTAIPPPERKAHDRRGRPKRIRDPYDDGTG